MSIGVLTAWLFSVATAWAQGAASTEWRVQQEFLTGVDDAVTAPMQVLAEDPMRWATQGDLARSSGVQLVRVNTHSGPRLWLSLRPDRKPDWLEIESYFSTLEDAGLAAVVVLAPWPGIHPEEKVDSCNIDDPRTYDRRVRELVRRVGHLVTAWEIDNEPDLAFSREPGWCPPNHWAHFARLTISAIRNVQPQAVVLLGGLYRPHMPAAVSWWAEVGAVGLDRRWFNGVAVHLYPEPEDAVTQTRTAIANARAAFELPVWVTEASTTGHRNGKGKRGEAEQARALVQLVAAARGAGAAAFFWHALSDTPAGGSAVPQRGLFRVEAKAGRPPRATRWGAKPALEAWDRARGMSAPMGRDGDLRWAQTEVGLLVWSVDEQGEGTPPGPLVGIAGGKVKARKDGSWWVRGLALVR